MKTLNKNAFAKRTVIVLTTVLAALMSGLVLAGCASKSAGSAPAGYEFTRVSLGTIEKTVSSSGSLNPVATVKVLPRMSGKVEKVYVDYNDIVKAGDILAELNTDMLRLQRAQQNAQVVKARANYELQRVNYQNQAQLAAKNLISDYELKSSKTTLDVQAAELAAAEASLKAIETEINQYAFVTSPIDGIVLARNISAGDTVVEGSNSNSTPMFTLAENLTEMQIEASVGELDVPSIRKGQAVRFTLESLPGRKFTGTVETLRMIPAVSNNVVSYTVIINVENQDGSLMPGMTCAVEFIEEQRQNILTISNAALRYQPSNLSTERIEEIVFNASLVNMNEEQQAAAIEARTARAQNVSLTTSNASSTGLAGLVSGGGAPGGMGMGMGGPGGNRGGGMTAQGGGAGSARVSAVTLKNLWYINAEGKLDCIQVRAGITNGTVTEVSAPEGLVLEGMEVILKEKVGGAKSSASSSTGAAPQSSAANTEAAVRNLGGNIGG